MVSDKTYKASNKSFETDEKSILRSEVLASFLDRFLHKSSEKHIKS